MNAKGDPTHLVDFQNRPFHAVRSVKSGRRELPQQRGIPESPIPLQQG